MVVVDREIGKTRVPTMDYLSVNEGGAERPIAILTSDVVAPELSGFDVSDKEPQGLTCVDDTGVQDGAMFIPVTGVQVGHELRVGFGWDQDVTGFAGH